MTLTKKNTIITETIHALQEENKKLEQKVLKYRAKEVINKRMFDYILCTRKNGSKFIKIIYDSHEIDGWVEIAKINLSRNEWVQNNFSIEDVLGEVNNPPLKL